GAFTIDAAVPSTTTKDASNAEVTLWAGTAAAQTVTSATNTFAELLPGVSVTVSAASVDPVTVTVYRDTVKASKVAEDMVSSLNEVLAHISLKSVVTTSATDGVTSVNGGPFTGDSTVRETRQRLVNAASAPVNGSSPSEIGISITKTGVLEFDATKFAKALADDPAKVSSMMQEIASRVADKAGEASNKTDGLLTSKITGQESLAKNFSTQVVNWDSRLEIRRATLERTYAAMEVRLSALNSQASFLTSQLAGLSTGSDK
ncbi:MAG: hypothetical protein JWP30_1965, partial [Homoserinimonas sp.]|nr:hypothetical protein [Homoserinimonas sp.]